jgi:hypothetical protein
VLTNQVGRIFLRRRENHGPPHEPKSPKRIRLRPCWSLANFRFFVAKANLRQALPEPAPRREAQARVSGFRAGATERATREGVDLAGASSRSDRRRELRRWIRLGPEGFPTNPAARTGERRFVPLPAGLAGGAVSSMSLYHTGGSEGLLDCWAMVPCAYGARSIAGVGWYPRTASRVSTCIIKSKIFLLSFVDRGLDWTACRVQSAWNVPLNWSAGCYHSTVMIFNWNYSELVLIPCYATRSLGRIAWKELKMRESSCSGKSGSKGSYLLMTRYPKGGAFLFHILCIFVQLMLL